MLRRKKGILKPVGIVHNRRREMKRSGLRTLCTSPALRATLSFCALLLFASCNSSQETTYTEADSPLAAGSDSTLSESELTAEPDSPAVGRIDIVTGPASGNSNREVGLTVGERLKKLDLLMQTAPPDSLGLLMAEYERLLDSAMGGPAASAPPATEYPSSSTPIAAEPEYNTPTTPRSTPRSSINGNGDNRTLVQSDNEAARQFDPTTYGGARESELEHYRENRSAQSQPTESTQSAANGNGSASSLSGQSSSTGTGSRPTSSTTSRTSGGTGAKGKGKKESGSKKGKKGKKNRAASTPAVAETPSSSPEPKANKSSSLNENYTEGLAHFRAGRYKQAITSLKPVANSSGSYRTTAKYYYALSLERTGSLAQAASHFRSLSKGSGAIADKGWLGYCRVLSAQGKKSEAKKELLRLIKQRPGSSQIASAKQMLQKL